MALLQSNNQAEYLVCLKMFAFTQWPSSAGLTVPAEMVTAFKMFCVLKLEYSTSENVWRFSSWGDGGFSFIYLNQMLAFKSLPSKMIGESAAEINTAYKFAV